MGLRGHFVVKHSRRMRCVQEVEGPFRCNGRMKSKRTPILFKFKNVFPPNDKAEPRPMLTWNSYVSALYFASDSTCLCLGV